MLSTQCTWPESASMQHFSKTERFCLYVRCFIHFMLVLNSDVTIKWNNAVIFVPNAVIFFSPPGELTWFLGGSLPVSNPLACRQIHVCKLSIRRLKAWLVSRQQCKSELHSATVKGAKNINSHITGFKIHHLYNMNTCSLWTLLHPVPCERETSV